MTSKLLPKKLGKEPLIDVVCGVNFESDIPADTLFPGLLLPKLPAGSQPKFETLPAAQLPQTIRDNDPNLKNSPLMRIVVDEKFTVLIGSKSLGVGCQMPYAGWSAFREMIQIVFNVLDEMPYVNGIEKHSLKYVDFIKSQGASESLSRFNLKIEIADLKLSNQQTQLRTEIIDGRFIHAATIISPATARQPDGVAIDGVLVDVDTHRIERFSLNEFLKQLPELLDEIHIANKTFFFNLLSEDGLQELEPEYE
ncbi:MAG: TIGR04255 family protein [Methylococcales bacterium]|nr:TIGR04255 family protein [Methylococcales bacterium]